MAKGKLLMGIAALYALDTWDRARHARDSWFGAEGGARGTAVVTGASSGIGENYARQLAALGYHLLLVARREDRLESLANELRDHWNVRADVLTADLTTDDGMQQASRSIQAIHDLDLLVNNAGFGTGERFLTGDIERQIDMVELHVEATTRLTRAALPGMIERGRGAIVNVASVAGAVSTPGSAVYGATKSYIISFCEALQIELTGTGVRVQALCPGLTRSEFHDHVTGRLDRDAIPEFVWMSSEAVVTASLQGLREERVVVVPGLFNKAGYWIGRLGLVGVAVRFLELLPEEQRKALPL